MMISTRGRYALRVMLDLASQEKEEYVSLADVAKRQEISLKYLESIMAALFKAGLVESRRGQKGGYRLAEDPGRCTVLKVLEAAEGSLASVACGGEECPRREKCLTLPFWRELDGVIDGYLQSVTLADILCGRASRTE